MGKCPCASLAISTGANVKAVQRMLGHASAAMTLDACANLFNDDLYTVARAWIRPARNQLWPKVARRGLRSTPHAPASLCL